MYHAQGIRSWCIVYPEEEERKVQEFVRCLRQDVARQLGIEVVEPRYFKVRGRRVDAYLDVLNNKVLAKNPNMVRKIFLMLSVILKSRIKRNYFYFRS